MVGPGKLFLKVGAHTAPVQIVRFRFFSPIRNSSSDQIAGVQLKVVLPIQIISVLDGFKCEVGEIPSSVCDRKVPAGSL